MQALVVVQRADAEIVHAQQEGHCHGSDLESDLPGATGGACRTRAPARARTPGVDGTLAGLWCSITRAMRGLTLGPNGRRLYHGG